MITLVSPQIISTRSWRLGTPGVSSGRFILSQLWKLKAKTPVSAPAPPEGHLTRPADAGFPLLGLHVVILLGAHRSGVSVCVLIPSPYKITSQVGWDSPLWSHVTSAPSLRPYFQMSHMLSNWGLRLQHMNCGGLIQRITGTRGTRAKQDLYPFRPNFSIKNFSVVCVCLVPSNQGIIWEWSFFKKKTFIFVTIMRITSCCKMHGSSLYTHPVSPMITSRITVV